MRFEQLEALRSVTPATCTALQGEDLGVLKDVDEADRVLEQNDQKRNWHAGNNPYPIPTMFPCSIVSERLLFSIY